MTYLCELGVLKLDLRHLSLCIKFPQSAAVSNLQHHIHLLTSNDKSNNLFINMGSEQEKGYESRYVYFFTILMAVTHTFPYPPNLRHMTNTH